MYSDFDIQKHLGKDIGIYPLIKDNIQGSCIQLTASKFAWSAREKKACVNNNKIIMAKHDTTVIMTNEVVYLSKNYAGYCMTRVSLLPFGLSSICTPVKPGWVGHLLISLHNHSDNDYELDVNRGFIIFTIHKLRSSSQRGDPRINGRAELLSNLGITISQEETDFLNEPYANDVKILFDKIKSDDIFQEIKREIWKRPKMISRIFISFVILCMGCLLIFRYWGGDMAVTLAEIFLAVFLIELWK